MEHSILYKEFSLADAGVVHDLHQSKRSAFSQYIERLLWWNKKINLVSRGVSRETLGLHILHSLVIAQAKGFQKSQYFVDAGTGGGLPGIPLAISYPDKTVILNDIANKKVLACKSMASDLGLSNVSVSAQSVGDIGEIDVIVSKHAFKINVLYELVQDSGWRHIILLKGRDEVEKELDGIEQSLKVEITDLYPGFQHDFFWGKALVEISILGDE